MKQLSALRHMHSDVWKQAASANKGMFKEWRAIQLMKEASSSSSMKDNRHLHTKESYSSHLKRIWRSRKDSQWRKWSQWKLNDSFWDTKQTSWRKKTHSLNLWDSCLNEWACCRVHSRRRWELLSFKALGNSEWNGRNDSASIRRTIK